MRHLIPIATLAVTAALGAGAWQRQAQLDRLAPLVGRWNVEAHIAEPPELRSSFQGTLVATWTMDKSFIELEATFPSRDSQQRPMKAVGYVTFDDAAIYSKQRYRAYLLASGDGRCLPLEGLFAGSQLKMSGTPITADGSPPRVLMDARFVDKNRIEISVDMETTKSKPVHLGSIRLTRKP